MTVRAVHAGLLLLASPDARVPRCATALMEQQPPPMNRRQRRAHLQPPGTPLPPPAQPATSLTPAVVAGVCEDHSCEQFFWDEQTRSSLLELLAPYERPLLVCAPALAVAAEEAGRPYLLLERDERFSFLSGFRPFDLERPSSSAGLFDGGARADAVLCDPPFANFELRRLRAVLEQLVPEEPAPAPLFLAYNGERAAEVRSAFAGGRWHDIEPLAPLGYESVSPKMQSRIVLFGSTEARVPASLTDSDQGRG